MTGNISYENLSDSLKQKLTESNVDIVNDLTTGGADKALSAEMGKKLNDKNPEFGVERINEYHAIRRFPLFTGWESNENYEALRLYFPNVELRGDIRIRTSMSTFQGGGAEVRFNFMRYPASTTNLQTYDFGVLSMSPLHATYFYYPANVMAGNETLGYRPLYSIYKKSRNIPLYIEVEFISASVNAGDILEAMTLEKTEVGSGSYDAPQQQSIFTHVGNSKQDLATAITGKGIATSKDDTFATMVANINKIDTGIKYAKDMVTADNGTKTFIYADGTGQSTLASMKISVPFQPYLIRATVKAGTEYHVVEYQREADSWISNTAKTVRYKGGIGEIVSVNLRADVEVDTWELFTVVLPAHLNGYIYGWEAYGRK